MSTKYFSGFWLILAFSLFGTTPVLGDSISAKEIRITFTLSGGNPLADTFFITGNGGHGFLGTSAQLFDGNTLLGTATGNSTNPFFSWVSSSSVYTLGSPPIIDFSSFQSGKINGVILITSLPGSQLVIPSLSNFFVGFDLHATDATGGFDAATVKINSVTVVPELGTLLLFVTGLFGIFGAGRWKAVLRSGQSNREL